MICFNLKISDWGFKLVHILVHITVLSQEVFVQNVTFVIFCRKPCLGTWWMSWPLGYHGQVQMSTCTKLRTTMMHLTNGTLISLEKKQRQNTYSHMGHTWKILAYYSH